MRTEFNNLVELMNRYDLYKKDDEVGIALNNLEQKITEVEKRLVCVNKTAIEIHESISKYTENVDRPEAFIMKVNDHDSIQRGSNDIMIACDLSDDEPIDNNWYQLFEEPEENVSRETFEEPKVLIPKGSIVVWDYSRKHYSAIGGAKAKVSEDYKEDDKTIKVEWLDERANNQKNGEYERDMFKKDFELPKKEEPKVDEKINNYDNIVKNVIDTLNEINVDGETMQYILEQVGMSEQIHRQLVMKNDYKVTKDLMREKFELEL